MCFGSVIATCDLSRLFSPKSAEDSSLHYDLQTCQDRLSLRATRLRNIYRGLVVLGKILGEPCMVQSKAWKVMGDLAQTAFGTAMFSQRPDNLQVTRRPKSIDCGEFMFRLAKIYLGRSKGSPLIAAFLRQTSLAQEEI